MEGMIFKTIQATKRNYNQPKNRNLANTRYAGNSSRDPNTNDFNRERIRRQQPRNQRNMSLISGAVNWVALSVLT